MEVWIVLAGYEAHCDVVGVYSSYEAADAACYSGRCFVDGPFPVEGVSG